MKTVYLFFAARRYWKNEAELQAAYRKLSVLAGNAEHFLITESDPDVTVPADCAVLVPMSGAIQKRILAAASQYETTVLYGAYIRGNAPDAICEQMLRCNTAPALMDVWGVLRRTHTCAQLALNAPALSDALSVLEARRHVRHATLLHIGTTEPWVVSNASSPTVYTEKLGVKILSVAQSELAELYSSATVQDAQPWLEQFRSRAHACMEPTETDLANACRMAWALHTLLERYHADGCAIACFDLLKTGTTACLGVSFINDCTDRVAACEGDLDSAVTMLLMKKLTNTRLWMANPGLQPDGSINFSHCTAPLCCTGTPLPCTLRSHHESGIGVSVQVEIPAGVTVTACRVSDEAGSMTIHRGTTQTGPYETACRTQLHIRLEDAQHYLDTALGCHQVFAFEDIAAKLEKLAALLGLRVL